MRIGAIMSVWISHQTRKLNKLSWYMKITFWAGGQGIKLIPMNSKFSATLPTLRTLNPDGV